MSDDEDRHMFEAALGIENIRALLEQQQYEQQRLMADLQLAAIALADAVPTRSIPGDVADQVTSLNTNLKYLLRNARGELDEAARYLHELQTAVFGLDLR